MFFGVLSTLTEERDGRVLARRERWVSGAAVGGGGRCDLEKWRSGCDVELLWTTRLAFDEEFMG